MKKYLLLVVLLFFTIFTFGCNKQVAPDLMYIWKPKTKNARYLKAAYIQDLRSVIKDLEEYGHKIQYNGVGFSTNYKCQIGECTEEANAENWFYVVIEEGSVNSGKFQSYEFRAAYILQKRLEDILFALKKEFLMKSPSKIDGVLIGLIWSEKDKIKEMMKKPRFENIDVYIGIDAFRDYQNRTIKFDDLIRKIVFIKTIDRNSEIIESPF